MRAETFDARLFCEPVRFHDLVRVNAELGVRSGVGDEFADVALAVTGVDAERKQFRPAELQKTRQNGDVVEVENHSGFESLFDVVVGEEVSAEHDVFAGEPDAFREQDFIDACAVRAGAFLTQNVHDCGIVAALDRVEHFEIRIIFFESRPDFAVVGANLRLIVDISRCSKRIGDFIDGNAADVNFPVFDFHEKTPSLLFYGILAQYR